MLIFSALLLALLALLALLIGVGELYTRYQCSNYQAITGTETRHAAFDTCYIHTAGGWQRWDEYKARATASEGLKETR